eukprot:TRINITY_DN2933_c5_g5_i2.p1 TRINITY_DN2933_c5_g5~~TRINITY_DN2933_c5_g5_i2.p1  ORF type:complete len:441 (+),score=97.42 TRINITY_DN2933_c5_g5_i2:133-1455(+)
MSSFSRVFGAVIPTMGVMALGSVCQLLKVFNKNDLKILNRFVFNIGLPALLLNVFANTDSKSFDVSFLCYAFLFKILSLPSTFLLTFISVRFKESKYKTDKPAFFAYWAMNYSTLSWPNGLILGLPIGRLLFGNIDAAFALYAVGDTLLQFPIAILLLSISKILHSEENSEELSMKELEESEEKKIVEADIKDPSINTISTISNRSSLDEKEEYEEEEEEEEQTIKVSEQDDIVVIVDLTKEPESKEQFNEEQIWDRDSTLTCVIETPIDEKMINLAANKHENRSPSIAKLIFIRVATNPVLLSITAGLIFTFLIILPNEITTMFEYIGNTVLGVLLFTLGAFCVSLKIAKSWKLATFTLLIKLTVSPIIMSLVVLICKVEDNKDILIFLSVLPQAFASFALFTEFEVAEDIISICVIVTTIGMIITMPVYSVIFGWKIQ